MRMHACVFVCAPACVFVPACTGVRRENVCACVTPRNVGLITSHNLIMSA